MVGPQKLTGIDHKETRERGCSKWRAKGEEGKDSRKKGNGQG
jgi:hypothetical protein